MKVGILTHYYGSNNYGGVLQAYALVRVLRNMGYDAEQICFPLGEHSQLNEACVKTLARNDYCNTEVSQKHIGRLSQLLRFLAHGKTAIANRTVGLYVRRKEKKRFDYISNTICMPREKSFDEFRDSIEHSPVSYTQNTLFLANEVYDVFITGSDQVWNLQWQRRGFFLEFVDSNKKKIAFAASAGSSVFDNIQSKYLQRVLPKFDAISVREQDLVDAYRTVADVDSTFVLDPTLLLDKGDWDEIASPRLIDERYLFCFFYNPTEKPYKIVKQYAQKHGLKIGSIPYALRDPNIRMDDKFGDYRFGAASPADFISLVKYADCVFTDSFHCNVFSVIYNRPFFSFDRIGMGVMNSRIISLTELFDCCDRFCSSEEKMSLNYLETVQKRTYKMEEYYALKDISIAFLKGNLRENDS